MFMTATEAGWIDVFALHGEQEFFFEIGVDFFKLASTVQKQIKKIKTIIFHTIQIDNFIIYSSKNLN